MSFLDLEVVVGRQFADAAARVRDGSLPTPADVLTLADNVRILAAQPLNFYERELMDDVASLLGGLARHLGARGRERDQDAYDEGYADGEDRGLQSGRDEGYDEALDDVADHLTKHHGFTKAEVTHLRDVLTGVVPA